MSETVKRYDLSRGTTCERDGCEASMWEEETGEYVLYADLTALQAKLAGAEGKLAHAEAVLIIRDAQREEAEADRDMFHRDWQGLLEHHETIEEAVLVLLEDPDDHHARQMVEDLLSLQGDMKPSDLSALKARVDALTAFVESIVNAVGPYPYVNGTQLVADAYAALSQHKPEGSKL